MHYSIMSIIPGLIGGILMTIIVYVTQNSFGRLSLQDFEPLPISFNYPWYMAMLGIIMPTLIYVLASFVTVSKLINKDVTSLLRGAGKESKQSSLFKNLKATTRTKFAFRSIFINKGRSFVVLLGIFASTLILSIAFMMFDTIDAIVDTALAKVGSFEYEYTLSFPELETEDDSNDKINKLLCFIYEYDDKKVPVMGANGDDIDLWTTKLVDGTVINETNLNDNTYYITSLAASLMHVGVGDTVTVKSNFSGDDFTFKVSGIIDNGLLSYILTSKRNVALALSNLFITVINNTLETKIETTDELTDALAENLYNVILSKEPQQLDSSNIMMIFEKSSIVQQKDAKMAERAPIIYTVLIIGIFVCVIAIFVVVNVIIDDNIGNISMLRVLGYKNNEINWMILSGNHYLVPIGIVIGMPIAYLILSIYFTTTVKNNNMIMPVTMSFKTIALVIGIILACYFGTLLILRKKANRVSMIESLKDNR